MCEDHNKTWRRRRTSKPMTSFWAQPYIMISCAIAVLMLRLGRRFLARSSENGECTCTNEHGRGGRALRVGGCEDARTIEVVVAAERREEEEEEEARARKQAAGV